MPRRIILTSWAALLAAAAISACSATVPSKPNIEHMLATAKTASDHEAIAEYYETEAADAKGKYEEHEASAVHYDRVPKWKTWAWHCDALAQDFKAAEQDASVLAAQHRKIAEEMNSTSESHPVSSAPAPAAERP